MRRFRQSRSADRDPALHDLFTPDGMEGEPYPSRPDVRFPLRPLAAGLPNDDVVVTDPRAEGSESDLLFRRAAEQVARRRPAEAVITYRSLLELDEHHVEARSALATILEAQDDLDGAVDQLTLALVDRPADPRLLAQRGAVLAILKRYPDAEADLRRALRESPEHPAALFHLGLLLHRKGLPGEAVTTLRHAIHVDSANSAAQFYLGEALHHQGDLAGAEIALRRAADLDLRQGRALHLLGRILDRQGRSEEAREMYQRAREAAR
ncbi:MAG TPA: tetratricopeptide repeat protein [Gemmatimonadales bacterium]|nr:tetratricopeptide repeat protein [Gemmatimonadales bacterium]